MTVLLLEVGAAGALLAICVGGIGALIAGAVLAVAGVRSTAARYWSHRAYALAAAALAITLVMNHLLWPA